MGQWRTKTQRNLFSFLSLSLSLSFFFVFFFFFFFPASKFSLPTAMKYGKSSVFASRFRGFLSAWKPRLLPLSGHTLYMHKILAYSQWWKFLTRCSNFIECQTIQWKFYRESYFSTGPILEKKAQKPRWYKSISNERLVSTGYFECLKVINCVLPRQSASSRQRLS